MGCCPSFQSFYDTNKLKQKKNDASKSYKCPNCKNEFEGKSVFEKHISETILGRCPSSENLNSGDRTSMINQMKTSKQNNDDSKNKSYICSNCQAKFPENRSLKLHMLDCKKKRLVSFPERIKPYKCNVCDESYDLRHSLIMHVKSVHERKKLFFNCQYCEAGYSSKSKLNRHIAWTHLNIPQHVKTYMKKNIDGEKLFKCDLCEAEYSIKIELTRHIEWVHGGQGNDDTNLAQENCEIEEIQEDLENCNSSTISLKNHALNIEGKNDVQDADDEIQVIGMITRNTLPENPKHNLDNSEENEKASSNSKHSPKAQNLEYQNYLKFKADQKKYESEEKMEEQKKATVQDHLNSFDCSNCNAKFNSNSDRIVHIATVHNYKGNSALACQVNCTSTTELDQHSLSVRMGKKHKCFICNTSFVKKADLLKHFKTNLDQHLSLVNEGNEFEALNQEITEDEESNEIQIIHEGNQQSENLKPNKVSLKKKIYYKCVVPNCTSTGSSGFSVFPKNPILRQVWENQTQVKCVKSSVRICHLHFKPSDFKQKGPKGQTCLLPHRVPSLHLPIKYLSPTKELCKFGIDLPDLLEDDGKAVDVGNVLDNGHYLSITSELVTPQLLKWERKKKREKEKENAHHIHIPSAAEVKSKKQNNEARLTPQPPAVSVPEKRKLRTIKNVKLVPVRLKSGEEVKATQDLIIHLRQKVAGSDNCGKVSKKDGIGKICSKHFDNSHFINEKKLKPTAVPTLHLGATTKNSENTDDSNFVDLGNVIDDRKFVNDSICPVCQRSTYIGETINCEKCEYWFHFECVGVTPEDSWVQNQDVPYFCPNCGEIGTKNDEDLNHFDETIEEIDDTLPNESEDVVIKEELGQYGDIENTLFLTCNSVATDQTVGIAKFYLIFFSIYGELSLESYVFSRFF